ncbi:trifunctional serine/threonine-protein kinase/ATP-binding protein/sensor histidine kinase [Dapis sp. BLCC M126]|uniref:trifunctional serine/threonine-protein kinase/ATP-binding protein/sensor histidine kinase n=1 Tax=Dapis sp. BLCC M126 TaxID=3400189 RepID=UPI003CED422D
MLETKNIKIANYQTLELIHESERTLVYRGRNIETQQPVIIKLMAQEYPSFNELVQFRNQYAIAKNLDILGILKHYSLLRYKNGYALIMEDIEAISLAEYQHQFCVSLQQFCEIALSITEILHHLHQNQIIHKDIKPANILIHPETKQVKLIDFSISSLLPKERTSLQTPNVLEGTLAYISPEQTGRMNRGIDYRSDFYSLGVTLYELLTGKLPFESEDPLELVHAHIAKTPPTIPDVKVPTPLANIVVKLMAKNAEERYQSALGLKYDLEKCRVEYIETGKIESFVLAEQDRSARFLIPEKLYGREKEVKTLLDAFERVAGGKTEMILVAGFSGIGKTAVVNEVHKPITRKKGYFIKGKYDQFNRNIPFSAFVQAFRDLMGQLLGESNAQLQKWKGKILEAVGENGQVLIEVIPELERIIGAQPPVPELSGSAAQNRFNLLFEKFSAVFTTKEHPLTLFLDDLQWVDSASLNLLKVLIGDTRTGYLFLLGAYRDNEVFPAHPLMLTLAELEKRCSSVLAKDTNTQFSQWLNTQPNSEQERGRTPTEQNVTISTITLAPLSLGYINQLIAETLSCSVELAVPLTDLVYQKTKGNPFFTTQFLKGLHEDELITFNPNMGYWECDLVKVRDAALTDDVVEFMATRLHKLPEETQKVLKLAACIGNQFDLETLAIIYQTSSEEVATALWSALREGLILPQSEAYKFFQGWEKDEEKVEGIAVGYRFLHDRVQQAAYSLIPDDQKQITHYQIGQLIYKNTPKARLEEDIFSIVVHLNRGLELLSDRHEKKELAQLNLTAGKKAIQATAYAAALEYLSVGQKLLPENYWKQEYKLALSLHQELALSNYLNGDFSEAQSLIETVLEQAKTTLDKAQVYEIAIQSLMSQHKLKEAVSTGLEILDAFGIQFPENTSEDVQQAFETMKANLAAANLSVGNLLELPNNEDPVSLAIARIMARLYPALFGTNPNLLILALFQAVDSALHNGNDPLIPFAYVSLAYMIHSKFNNSELGFQFGQLAIDVLNKLDAKEVKGKTFQVFYGQVKGWQSHIKETIEPLLEGYQSSLEVGDLEYAGYSATIYCYHSYFAGVELSTVEAAMKSCYTTTKEKLKQTRILYLQAIFYESVLNLQGKTDNTSRLLGSICNEDEAIPILQQQVDYTSLNKIYLNKMILSYLFEDYSAAIESAKLAEENIHGVNGLYSVPVFYWYDSLVRIAYFSEVAQDEQVVLLQKVSSNQEKLKQWMYDAPMNYAHKFNLVEAEQHRVMGQKLEAMEFYEKAIAGAKENKYIQEEALANELFSKFYLDWGRDKEASLYMQEAYYCYAQWGAKAKIEHLEKKYHQLLNPILQRQKLGGSANSTISTLTKGTLSHTGTSTGEVLDLASLMKASRSLSQEIDLERTIVNFIQVIQQNAGAETASLMLFQADVLMLTAHAIGTEMSVINIPVDTSNNLPLTLVHKVKNTGAYLVLDNAKEDSNYDRDDYIQKHQIQSVLCIPLINRGQLIGILYLENNQTSGAFTIDRIELLNLLCSQAAISLENAQLYNNLEIKVQERTAELSQALEKLKNTQKQLVESEKMASLGGLVAGVAHEINTPVGTSITVASTLNQETQAFAETIASGQIKRSFLNDYIETSTECTQLIVDNLKRAGELIGSFKQVAVDQSNLEIRTFAIKPYLEELLTSLMPKIRQRGHQVNIEGDENLNITTYPGALAQIVTNLTNNSLVHAYRDGKTGKLNWRIEQVKERLIIEYTDDGCGISQAELSQIFEPFYTTARNQGGSGLGLHIVYNLVTQKLQGTILAHSQLGEGINFTLSIPQ